MADVTSFSEIYKVFFSKITEDMYMELSPEDTEKLVDELFINALPWFEFPRQDIYDYDWDTATYNIQLTKEEINIIAVYMVVEWLGQQLASVENARMKYSGLKSGLLFDYTIIKIILGRTGTLRCQPERKL